MKEKRSSLRDITVERFITVQERVIIVNKRALGIRRESRIGLEKSKPLGNFFNSRIGDVLNCSARIVLNCGG